MKILFPLAYCILLATVLAAQTSTTETPSKESENCTLEGRVVLAAGGLPLKKVAIHIFSDDAEQNSYTTLTDVDGHFKIEELKPGHYNVHLDRNGYVDAGKRRGRYYSQALTIRRGQELKDLVFRMQPAAVITGKIVDADGDPVPETSIFVTRYGAGSRQNLLFRRFQRTDDLGEYRVFDLPPGRYLVLAQSWSAIPATPATGIENTASPKTETVYAPTYYPGTMDKSQATAIELHAGDQVPVNFALVTSRSFRIRGTVSGLTMAVGSQIGIEARSTADNNGRGQNQDGKIDKDGKFEIRDLLPGSYTLVLAVQDGRSSQGINTGQTVEVTNADVNGLHIQPAPNGQIRGQFHMDSGQKVDWSQSMVILNSDEDSDRSSFWRFGGGSSRFAEVKSDGSFELKNVPAGAYHLVASSRAQALRDYFVKSVNLGGKDVSDTGFTTVGASYSLDIVVSARGATVEGTVLDANDKPVVDAEVVAIPDPNRRTRRDLYQQDSTDQRGHFTLHGVNPGQYSVIAFEDFNDDYSDPDFLKPYEGRGQSVEIKEGERKTVQLKVVPATEEQP